METWLSDRILLPTLRPKSGNTGEFDIWISDRKTFDVYVEAAAAGGGVVNPIVSSEGIASVIFGGQILR